MTVEEMASVFEPLIVAYPAAKQVCDESTTAATVHLYAMAFAGEEYWIVKQAAWSIIQKVSYFPSVAQFAAEVDEVKRKIKSPFEGMKNRIQTLQRRYELTDKPYRINIGDLDNIAKIAVQRLGGINALYEDREIIYPNGTRAHVKVVAWDKLWIAYRNVVKQQYLASNNNLLLGG